MKTQFNKVIERFEILSRLSNEESQYSKEIVIENADLGVAYRSSKYLDLKYEPSPCYYALEAFLRNLPDTHVIALCNLMYAGRENADKPSSFDSGIKAKEEAVISILEKTPRYEYLKTSLSKLDNGQINSLV